MTFLDALGRGDIAAAATTVGPISVQRTEAAGGLASMLRASTEGHGTWPSATDRTVTPIGLAPGLAVVVLQGTLRVEGTTERRVAAFPVRRAESANAWLVEPWAYDLSGSPPLEILTPAVDIEERATVPAGQPLELRVSAGASGTIYASYDAAPPLVRPASPNGPVTFATQSPAPTLVALVLDDGPVLAAAAFTISAATGTPAR
jgi:hypothetical protein